MDKGLEELYADHANMRVLLQLLESEMERYRNGAVPDFKLLQSIVNDIAVFQSLVHHPKEDLIYERLIKRDPTSVEPILDFMTDHARLALLSRRFAAALSDVANKVEVPRGWFDQLLADCVTAMRSHMEIEEKEFFPRAADCLTDEDWREVDDMVEKIKALRIATTVGETKLWLNDQLPEG